MPRFAVIEERTVATRAPGQLGWTENETDVSYDVVDYERSAMRGDEPDYYVMATCGDKKDAEEIAGVLEVAYAANIMPAKQAV